jgi:hypothetical protein
VAVVQLVLRRRDQRFAIGVPGVSGGMTVCVSLESVELVVSSLLSLRSSRRVESRRAVELELNLGLPGTQSGLTRVSAQPSQLVQEYAKKGREKRNHLPRPSLSVHDAFVPSTAASHPSVTTNKTWAGLSDGENGLPRLAMRTANYFHQESRELPLVHRYCRRVAPARGAKSASHGLVLRAWPYQNNSHRRGCRDVAFCVPDS